MKKTISILFVAIAITASSKVLAQDKITVSGNVDVVSNYVWRGYDQGSGCSVQPGLSVSTNGLSLSLWGSQSLSGDVKAQELDITLAYSISGFSISVADLWWGGINGPYGYYISGPATNPIDGGHHFEGTLAYDFNETFEFPLTVSWSTWFAGADALNQKGKRAFSSYVNIAYEIACPSDISITPAIGYTPWAGYYYDKSGVTDITLKVSKELKINEFFTIPVYLQAIASPICDHAYLIAGLGISF